MKLKNVRQDKNISQRELSKLSGVSIRNIQAYEQGQIDINNASAVSVYRLCKALNCKYEDILDIKNS